MPARTEISDAWAGIALVDSLLTHCRYKQADSVLRAAERHYRIARALVRAGQSDSILNKLADLRAKLDHIGSVISANSEALETRQAAEILVN
jgi:hypothetical protein